MKVFAILGSGFGLYGYLPAVLSRGDTRVVLPHRAAAPFAQRKELSAFAGRVRWASEAEALAAGDAVILALPPAQQRRQLPQALAHENIRRVYLEKPPAENPRAARELLRQLQQSGKEYRIAYLFWQTQWARRVAAALPHGGGRLECRWRFMAHHYRCGLSNWKRSADAGGGALRFYGIHLIALLAGCGYDRVVWSETRAAQSDQDEDGNSDDCHRWTAGLRGAGLPECEALVDSRAAEQGFEITLGGAALANAADPLLESARSDALDRRVPLLVKHLFDPQAPDATEFYRQVVRLWAQVEAKNRTVLQ